MRGLLAHRTRILRLPCFVDRMARRQDDVQSFGIEVLNEPKLPMRFLKRFAQSVYIAADTLPEKAVVFHDGFNSSWYGSRILADRRQVNGYRKMDTHVYLTFLTEQKIERFLAYLGMHAGRTLRVSATVSCCIHGA